MTDTVKWNCIPLQVVLKVQNSEEEKVKIHYSWQIWRVRKKNIYIYQLNLWWSGSSLCNVCKKKYYYSDRDDHLVKDNFHEKAEAFLIFVFPDFLIFREKN